MFLKKEAVAQSLVNGSHSSIAQVCKKVKNFFQVSGFRFQVSGLRFKVSGLRFRV